MSNDQDQRAGVQGRGIAVRAFGDTANEIEMAAIDEARAVFGEDVRMEIVRNYRINRIDPDSALTKDADGKRYVATVLVRAID
jgi:hypothetical protein